jgi:hypothetical protein
MWKCAAFSSTICISTACSYDIYTYSDIQPTPGSETPWYPPQAPGYHTHTTWHKAHFPNSRITHPPKMIACVCMIHTPTPPPTPHPTDDSSNKFSSPFWLRGRPTTWWNDRWHVRSYWRAVLPRDRHQLYTLTGRPWYQLSRYLQSPASCLLLLVFYS